MVESCFLGCELKQHEELRDPRKFRLGITNLVHLLVVQTTESCPISKALVS